MGQQRRNKTTPNGIGHLSNPTVGRSGKGRARGPLEPVVRDEKSKTTSGRQELDTAGWQVWGETLKALIMGISGLLTVARLEIIHCSKRNTNNE